jgi:hypothetical protein
VTEEEKKSIAFRSYFLRAVEPRKYPRDKSAVSKVAELHDVHEKTVWNARAKYPADPQRIRDITVAIEHDPAAEQRLMKHIWTMFGIGDFHPV